MNSLSSEFGFTGYFVIANGKEINTSVLKSTVRQTSCRKLSTIHDTFPYSLLPKIPCAFWKNNNMLVPQINYPCSTDQLPIHIWENNSNYTRWDTHTNST